jgi:hypothetical protein
MLGVYSSTLLFVAFGSVEHSTHYRGGIHGGGDLVDCKDGLSKR